MTKKFNPKQYQGKPRVYLPVTGAPGVLRLWVWDLEACQYGPPARGKCYEARRRVDGVRQKQSFDSLQAARDWQSSKAEVPMASAAEQVGKPSGMLFSTLVDEWRKRTFSSLAESTRRAYDKIVRLHLGSFMGLTIHEITPKRVDQWIDELKDPKGKAMQHKTRRRFNHELDALSNVLKYYQSYHDDSLFQFPIKARHKEAVILNRPTPHRPKDMTEAEFEAFRVHLSRGRHGKQLAAMATVQYYQALRVSEVAALHWEDASFNLSNPKASRLRVVRKVEWPRVRGLKSYVVAGFKNAEENGGVKEHPLFFHSFAALKALHKPGATGLVFQVNGRHFEYRQVQYAYDRAYRAAGLPYTGTHVMRHGGCRRVYNETGDLSIAQQHLGNSSIQTTQIYAKRSVNALSKVAEAEWEAYEAGRKGSQSRAAS